MQDFDKETLDQLIIDSAHDLDNILAGIRGYIELAMLNLDRHHSCYNYQERVLRSTEKASALVGQLLIAKDQNRSECRCTKAENFE